MTDKNAPKNAAQFVCEHCDYICSKQSDYNRHSLTQKHARLTNTDKILTKTRQKRAEPFLCNCGKQYKHRQSLFNHKQTCDYSPPDTQSMTTADILDMIKSLVKDNQEFTKELVNSLVAHQSHNSNNVIHSNSHNKTFNLQLFLNETCKNAMNLTDFLDSIKLQLSDLIKVGEVGYVEGISNIIASNLKALDVTQRPIHCTDKKREIVYIKDEDKWEKDDDNYKLRNAIKLIAYKNEKLLPEYKQRHPRCNYSDSIYADQYSKIVIEAMSGDKDKDDKIIKNIAKLVTIDKCG
ncbi:MAG: hypothetical protein ACOVRN_04895 [Flavobacterium sp.]